MQWSFQNATMNNMLRFDTKILSRVKYFIGNWNAEDWSLFWCINEGTDLFWRYCTVCIKTLILTNVTRRYSSFDTGSADNNACASNKRRRREKNCLYL